MTMQVVAARATTKQGLRFSWQAMGKRLLALGKGVMRIGRAPRRLRLCESLPLGERRFVAVVEFENARFLLGGTPSALVLLSRLADRAEHAEVDEEMKRETQEETQEEKRGAVC
jgi:flagellar biogenesis protein FliO